MSTAAPEPKANMGQPVPRYDAVAKVTGKAEYAADMPLSQASLCLSRHQFDCEGPHRRLRSSRCETCSRRDRYRDIRECGQAEAGEAFQQWRLCLHHHPAAEVPREIAHDGEIVAVVVADTFEAAREAAHTGESELHRRGSERRPSIHREPPRRRQKASSLNSRKTPRSATSPSAFDQAEVKLTAAYETPTQHHNPMELFATSCVWNGDRLTIYEPSQYVYGLKNGVAEQLGIDPDQVRVINPYVGGAFGSKGSITPRTAIIASIARRLGRPVKLVATRDQGFTIATYRAETRHRDSDRRQPATAN